MYMLSLFFIFLCHCPHIASSIPAITETRLPLGAYHFASTIILPPVPKDIGRITALSLNKDGTRAMIITCKGVCLYINMMNQTVLAQHIFNPLAVFGINASQKLVITRPYQKEAAEVWSLSDITKSPKIIPQIPKNTLLCELSGDGRIACFGSPLSSEIVLHDIDQKKRVCSIEHSEAIDREKKYTTNQEMQKIQNLVGIGLNERGTKLLVQSGQNITIYDSTIGDVIFTLNHRTLYHSIARTALPVEYNAPYFFGKCTWNTLMSLFAVAQTKKEITPQEIDETNPRSNHVITYSTEPPQSLVRSMTYPHSDITAIGMSGNGAFVALGNSYDPIAQVCIKLPVLFGTLDTSQTKVLARIWEAQQAGVELRLDYDQREIIRSLPPHIIASLCSSLPSLSGILSGVQRSDAPIRKTVRSYSVELTPKIQHRKYREHGRRYSDPAIRYIKKLTGEEVEFYKSPEEDIDIKGLAQLEEQLRQYGSLKEYKKKQLPGIP